MYGLYQLASGDELQFHSSHDLTERHLSGYTNAWASVMLRPLEPAYNEPVLAGEPLASAAFRRDFCGMAPEFGVPGVATLGRGVDSN